MTDLQSLLTRLEEAEGPDRGLDLAIGLAFGWRYAEVPGCGIMLEAAGDFYSDSPGGTYPALTESLDAALALVERVLPMRINDILSEAKSSVSRKHALHIRFWRPENGTYATALAMCVCISLLRAKLSEGAK